MVSRKNTKDKKVIKPATIKKEKPKIQKQNIVKEKEQYFFAKDLANNMGIASYDFFLIKRAAGIEDGSIITRSEMQKLYNKIIEG